MSKLPISHSINILGQPNEVRKQWAAYTLMDAMTGEIVHVGEIKLSQLTTLSDSIANPKVIQDRLYNINVFDISDNAGLCARAAGMKRRELNIPVLPRPRASAVECIETGERFPSAVAAAQAHNIAPSNLSNHLNNKQGFSHVGGRTYRKIV